jgi:hypothetical protein
VNDLIGRTVDRAASQSVASTCFRERGAYVTKYTFTVNMATAMLAEKLGDFQHRTHTRTKCHVMPQPALFQDGPGFAAVSVQFLHPQDIGACALQELRGADHGTGLRGRRLLGGVW